MVEEGRRVARGGVANDQAGTRDRVSSHVRERREPADTVRPESCIPPAIENHVRSLAEQVGLALATRDRLWLTRLFAPNVRLVFAPSTPRAGTTQGVELVVDELFQLFPAAWRRSELEMLVDVTLHGALLTVRRANRAVLRAMLEIQDGRVIALLVQSIGSTLLPAIK